MSIVFNNNENILHAYTQSQVLFSRHNDTLKGVKMGKRTGKPMGRPSKGMVMSKFNIELAIKSTQSMGQAGLYMGVSKNTFKKYANKQGLFSRYDALGAAQEIIGTWKHLSTVQINDYMGNGKFDKAYDQFDPNGNGLIAFGEMYRLIQILYE